MTCFLAWSAVLLLLPVIVLLYVTASPQQHARRLRSTGATYRTIATQLGVSPSTSRRYCIQ